MRGARTLLLWLPDPPPSSVDGLPHPSPSAKKLDFLEPYAILTPYVKNERTTIRLPVVVTVAHRGKALELDCEHETVTVRGLKGEKLGTVTWRAVIEQAGSAQEPQRSPETRDQPRVSLVLKVRYTTPTGKCMEGRAGGIGGGGMFIESTAPVAVGTELMLDFALPDRPGEWMGAKATVSWVCPKPDQYTFSPGMGVRFVELSAETRARILDFVNTHKRASL
jgi:uncharacterized protein (TIGR02266 family)